MAVILADDYVDVDELVSHYHRRKSTLLFLIAAIVFIFFGTLSGYSALQYSTAKLDHVKTTVTELAAVTADSEKCRLVPEDPICIKAKAIVADPDNAIKRGSMSEYPVQIAMQEVVYDFRTDPVAHILAVLLTQPVILRLQ